MSDRYVLDTDAVVDLLRGRHAVRERVAALSPDDLGVSTMTVAELLFGAAMSSDPVRSETEVRRLLDVVRTHAFGQHAAAAHARLRRALRAKPIGPNDLVIAATAVALGATLVTSNVREFGRVPGLRVEDWRPKAADME